MKKMYLPMDAPPPGDDVDTEEASFQYWEVVSKARSDRRRSFLTGTVLVTLFIAAILALVCLLVTGYDWGTSLLLAFIGSALFAAGAWTGFTAFDEWIEVRSLK